MGVRHLKKKHTATNIYMYFIALSVKDICGSVSGKKSKTVWLWSFPDVCFSNDHVQSSEKKKFSVLNFLNVLLAFDTKFVSAL